MCELLSIIKIIYKESEVLIKQEGSVVSQSKNIPLAWSHQLLEINVIYKYNILNIKFKVTKSHMTQQFKVFLKLLKYIQYTHKYKIKIEVKELLNIKQRAK